MFCNVGPLERIARLALAGAAAVPVLSGRQPAGFRKWMGIAAASELFTAYTRFCPANLLLRIDGCGRRSHAGGGMGSTIGGAIARTAASAVLPGGALTASALSAATKFARPALRGARELASEVTGHSDAFDSDRPDTGSRAVAVVGVVVLTAGVLYTLGAAGTPGLAAATDKVTRAVRQADDAAGEVAEQAAGQA